MPDYHIRQQEIQRTLESIVGELQKNEEQFWQLIEAIPNVVIIVDSSGVITYANRHVLDVFGYQPDELIDQSVDTLLPDNLRDRHESHRMSYFANPSNRSMGQGMDLIAKRKDGSVFPVEIGLGHLPSSEQQEAIAFIIDITERKRAQEAIVEKERLLRKSQAIAHIGSWEVNLDTGERVWSDEFYRICGLEPQSVEPSEELKLSMIHPDDRDKSAQALDYTYRTHEPYEIEKRIIRPDGKIRWVISQGEMSVDDVTGEKHLSGVFIDITERKMMQEKEMQLKLEQERLQVLSAFIQNFSHEFRTPLSIINSATYLLFKSDDETVRERKVDVVQQQVLRATHLIDMLLTMVELETISNVEFMPVKLVNTLEAVCHTMQSQYGEFPSITFEPTDVDSVIKGHAVYLFDALSQVVSNAYRFTPEDGSIKLMLEESDGWATITCEDTGTGIAPENLSKIFTSFWRQDEAHSTPGLGLGLTVTKKIVDLHGGTIEVESEVGKGTSFYITLPVSD